MPIFSDVFGGDDKKPDEAIPGLSVLGERSAGENDGGLPPTETSGGSVGTLTGEDLEQPPVYFCETGPDGGA